MVTSRVKEILLSLMLAGFFEWTVLPAYAAVPNASDQSAAERARAQAIAADEKKAAEAKALKDKAPKDTGVTAVNCPPQSDFSTVRVTSASKNKGAPTDIVELTDDIRVEITNLKTLWDHAKCATPPKQVLLYLDGRQITNVSPEPPTDPNQKELIFPLRRDDKSRDAWTAILGRPTWKPRELEVSVGIEGLYPVPSTAKIKLELIPKMALAFWLAIVALALWRVVKNRDMLRGTGPLPAAQRPYSLGRVQMMWWFYIALSSYLFIGIITGDYSSTITGTVLVLTGISAGTGLLATVIDKGNTPPAAASVSAAGLLAPAPTAKSKSVGIWTDIVSDASGYSVHRYQMAVWSVVLGLIFVWNVYLVLAMPQFSETLLALMGISAGTYVGGKNVEP